jgi:hypothetical protein
MHTMSKEISKTDAAKLEAAVAAFRKELGNMREAAGVFMRRTIFQGVTAIGKLHAELATIDGAPSIDQLHKELSESDDSVSKSTLDRWGRVAKRHAELEVEPTEGSASAVYATTEGGWTEARKQLDALTPADVADGDQLVEEVAKAMNQNPRKLTAPKKKELTAADVESAGYTPEAFAASVTALLDRVPADKLGEARKQLRAIVNGYKRAEAPVNA